MAISKQTAFQNRADHPNICLNELFQPLFFPRDLFALPRPTSPFIPTLSDLSGLLEARFSTDNFNFQLDPVSDYAILLPHAHLKLISWVPTFPWEKQQKYHQNSAMPTLGSGMPQFIPFPSCQITTRFSCLPGEREEIAEAIHGQPRNSPCVPRNWTKCSVYFFSFKEVAASWLAHMVRHQAAQALFTSGCTTSGQNINPDSDSPTTACVAFGADKICGDYTTHPLRGVFPF